MGLFCFLLALAWSPPTASAEIRVLCPNALRAPLLDAARAFARTSGHRIEFIFASVGAIHKRVATGESADVAIGTAQGVDALLRLGRAMEGSDVLIARTVLGLVMRKGAGATRVADAESLAQMLRDAASIVYPDAELGAPGGGQVAELLERLGLAQEIRARSRPVADSRDVAKRVAAGTAQLGIASMNDLVDADGVIVIGPIETPPTKGAVYAAVVLRHASSPEAARAFVAALTLAGARSALRAAGYAPAD